MLWAKSEWPLNRLDVVPGSWSTEPSIWESDASVLLLLLLFWTKVEGGGGHVTSW